MYKVWHVLQRRKQQISDTLFLSPYAHCFFLSLEAIFYRDSRIAPCQEPPDHTPQVATERIVHRVTVVGRIVARLGIGESRILGN